MPLKLEKQNIPKEFIENLPEGLKVISKKGTSYVVVEKLKCPKNHNLLSDTIKINGEPAIQLKIKGGGTEGTMFLDPYWGLHTKLFDFMFDNPSDKPVIKAFCPVCNSSLMVKRKCKSPGCKADECIEFILPDGKNRISACGQWGCPEHDMIVTRIPSKVKEMVNKINYPDIHTHSEAIGF
jgi:hypothetical protein